MKRGAIFDMDGTLFDTERLYQQAWTETADDFGLKRNPELGKAVSGSNGEKILLTIPQFFPEVDANEYFRRAIERVRREIEKNLVIKSGVVEILTYLKENGVATAIASSTETDAIIRHVKRKSLYKFFDAIVGGDMVTDGKPAPDIFLLAAKKLNLSPQDCYVFEDSANGIRGAAAANCIPIMVIDQIEPLEDVRKLCAGIFYNMNDALTAVKRNEI